MAALIGVPASVFSVPVKPLADAPPAFPLGVPSDILERRPDVAQAERQMASANAQIGVARSAYFPSVGISGTGGLETRAISTLFNAPSGFWALGANVAQTVLSGGRRKAQLPLPATSRTC
jgi:outer membrane protein TolC